MDYLFLHRDKRTFTSERQKNLLFRAARFYWEEVRKRSGEKLRKVDCDYINMYCIFGSAPSVSWPKALTEKAEARWLKRTRLICPTWSTATSVVIWKSWWTRIRWNMPRNCSRSGKCPPEDCLNAAGSVAKCFYASFKKGGRCFPKRYMKYGIENKHSESTELCITNFSF